MDLWAPIIFASVKCQTQPNPYSLHASMSHLACLTFDQKPDTLETKLPNGS